MEKEQIIILEDRGLISITGDDAKDFLQNIITNDVNKVSVTNTVFSGLFTPQGKYLFEFFLIKSKNGYMIDCDQHSTLELINYLNKYKLRSNIKIKDISSDFVVGIISLDKFIKIQADEQKNTGTIEFRNSQIFIDTRNKNLGARVISSLERLYLMLKKLNLKIVDPSKYFLQCHSLGIPTKGIHNLKDQLFGLEANFEELQAIDFKKGCYIGQENTARMKLKNKLRRRLLPIETNSKLNIGDELIFDKKAVGKVLINGLYPFALINLFDPQYLIFKDKKIDSKSGKVKIIDRYY
jgi:folate-binding protein YgfZ|tara:strand:+ start:163 stop:1047 length:885 start_codon:yes stop_codon:yes gene_type:complete